MALSLLLLRQSSVAIDSMSTDWPLKAKENKLSVYPQSCLKY